MCLREGYSEGDNGFALVMPASMSKRGGEPCGWIEVTHSPNYITIHM
jgi:hypothetical protein